NEEKKAQFEKTVEDATQVGIVTEDATFRIQINGAQVIEEKTEELHQLWKGAIPCLLKSKA
ncbi:hypothetical protein R0K17_26515, partial [Planococcus sp. SIMBA_143]